MRPTAVFALLRGLPSLALLAVACDPATSTPAPAAQEPIAVVEPNPAPAPTSPFDAQVAISLHEVEVIEATMFDGHVLPKEVELVPYFVERQAAGVKPIIKRVAGETLAQTTARVRPWFDTIPIGADRRWLARRVPSPGAVDDSGVQVALVRGEGITITRGDIDSIELEPLPGVDVDLTDAGSDRLRARIDSSRAHDFAIEVAGRIVGTMFVPRGGAPSGLDVTDLGADPVALAIRNAIAGDPAAIDVVANDRAADGGTLEQHEIFVGIRPAPPVPSADGRERVVLHRGFADVRDVVASVAVPEGFAVRKQSSSVVEWARGPATARTYLRLTSGCNGECVPERLTAQIDAACTALSKTGIDVKTATVILDERKPTSRRCGVQRKRGAGSANLEDVMLHCYVRGAGDDVFLQLEVQAGVDQLDDALAIFAAACDSLREDSTPHADRGE